MGAPGNTAWRCYNCGATYGNHFTMCSSCFQTGCLLPLGRRPSAKFDGVPVFTSARRMAEMTWRDVASTAYPLRMGAKSLLLVSGDSAQGKSTFSIRLADGIVGASLYLSAEEGCGPTVAERLARCGVKREDFYVGARCSVDDAVDFAVEKKITSAVVDSVQMSSWSASELRHFLELAPSLLVLVAISQVNASGLPEGRHQYIHECDIHVVCERMGWNVVKSRYQEIAGVGGSVLPRRDSDEKPTIDEPPTEEKHAA